MTERTNTEKRDSRIARLIDELLHKSTVSAEVASGRCKAIALELAELFRATEMEHRRPESSVPDRIREAEAEARADRNRSRFRFRGRVYHLRPPDRLADANDRGARAHTDTAEPMTSTSVVDRCWGFPDCQGWRPLYPVERAPRVLPLRVAADSG